MFCIKDEKTKITFQEDFIRMEYACENGAHHSYSCCPSCWNNHPRHIEGTDFREKNIKLYSEKYGGQIAMATEMAKMVKSREEIKK